MLIKIINALFTPIELKTVEYEIKILLNQSFPYPPQILIDKALMACQIDHKAIVYSIKKEKRLPHELALTIINNVTADMLTSGRYHSFRGVLDDAEGARLYSIFQSALEMLSKHRYLSEQEADAIKKSVDIDIAMVG